MSDSADTSADDKEYILVTEYFHPDTASTGQLMTDLATGLEERGLDLTVYTGQPNYHSGENQKQPTESVFENVLVKRIRAPQMRQSSLARRLLNWAVFTVWMSVRLLVSQSDRERELIFVTCPPTLPVAMWMICTLRDWEYTYIAYDLYPDEPVELGYLNEEGLVHRLWEGLDAIAFENAKRIVALGPVMKDRIAAKTGPDFDRNKIHIIHNWEDEEFIEPKTKEENWFSKEHDLVEPFTVLYSGNIAEFHNLETLIKAAAKFDDENVRFLIIGEGDNKETIVSMAEERGIRGDTVQFLPYQSWDDLPYSLTSADVSVVAVNEGFEGIVVSSKIYTAMAAGMSILGITQPYDDEATIIETFDAGFHAEQGDVEGVVEAIETWREHPELVDAQGQNARAAFEEYFTKTQSIDRYYRMLTDEEIEADVTRTATVQAAT
ncbi:glycosyltransferase family 4 protein [Halococcus sp. AFM35]|uniref:glycosyltransferase family 4 protein n=1 Tax=Halococcus sp. AFM35 TaxID=3421653 RepID=UPI003EB7A2F1